MGFKSLVKGALITAVLTSLFVLSANAGFEGVATVKGDGLRLRTGAGTGYDILATANQGDTALVIENGDNWCKVDFGTQVGYMSAGYLSVSDDVEADLGLGKVTTKGDPLNLRSEAATSGAILARIPNNATVELMGLTGGWFKVTYSGNTGYVSSEYITPVLDATGKRTDGENVGDVPSDLGQRIVAEAMRHVGKPYRSAAKGPNAFDCSGFTYYVVKQVTGGSIVLPGSSTGQWFTGPGQRIHSISELRTGDLFYICDPAYSHGKATSHVAIYAGNGMMVHAASHDTGVVYVPLREKDYRYFVGAIRLG